MFDFISRQVMNLAAFPRQAGQETALNEARRAAEREAPKTVVARPAVSEDQVILAGTTTPARPALPVHPAEPTETENRVQELLRRLRGQPRKSKRPAHDAEPTPDEGKTETEQAPQHFDRWA